MGVSNLFWTSDFTSKCGRTSRSEIQLTILLMKVELDEDIQRGNQWRAQNGNSADE